MAYYKQEWEQICLPRRATEFSAGYDFYMPQMKTINDVPTQFCTGIRVKIQPGWFLMLVPRSGLGFKYGMRLVNTAGIIDADYYNAENEGHIAAKFVSDYPILLHPGERYMQGIFLPYGLAAEEAVTGSRTGGFGSTGQ